MYETNLNISGEVVGRITMADGTEKSRIRWSDLDQFTQGYIQAIFYTEVAENAPDLKTFLAQCDSGDNSGSIPASAGFKDLSPNLLSQSIKDCAKFQATYRDLIEAGLRIHPDYDASDAGADYWYSRHGYGVGFAYSNLGTIGDKLRSVVKYSPVGVYTGTNGQIDF